MGNNTSKQILIDNQFRFWVSLFTFVVAALLVSPQSPEKLLLITGLFVGYCALFGLAHIQARSGNAGPFLQYTLLTVDVLAVSAAILLTGQIHSPLYILYIVVFGVNLYHESLAGFSFAVVLATLLYGGVAFWGRASHEVVLSEVAGQLLLLLILTGVLYAILRLMAGERRKRERLVSHALTMGKIADVLSGSLENTRETIKFVSRLIEEEMGWEGFKCRITIHKPDQSFLPPSGGRMGVHIPIVAGESIFGTLVVTRDKQIPLSATEQNFFSSVARSLGVYLHRSQLWDEFQSRKISSAEVTIAS